MPSPPPRRPDRSATERFSSPRSTGPCASAPAKPIPTRSERASLISMSAGGKNDKGVKARTLARESSCARDDCGRRSLFASPAFAQTQAAKIDRGRYRLDDHGHRPRPDDDVAGARAFLFRHGAQEERARDHGAKPRGRDDLLDPLGRGRLLARLHRRGCLHRHVRPLLPVRHGDGRREPARQDDPGSTVHALPDDLRDHHGRAGRRARSPTA